MTHECLQVTVSATSRAEADRIIQTAVEGRFAACGQLVGPVSSTYWWQDKVEHAEEWLCLLKTTRDRFPDLRRHIFSVHSQQVPEIVATAIVTGAIDYLDWVHIETTPRP